MDSTSNYDVVGSILAPALSGPIKD